MDTETMDPVASDVSEAIPLTKQLDSMKRDELVAYADDLGYQVAEGVTVPAIKDMIHKIVNERKSDAMKMNEESLAAVVDEHDPEITVRFFNMESPGADLEFAFSNPRGMFGPNNKRGHKKCPTYHLFPGEVVKIAHSVFEHLSNKTFVTHKTVWDPITGMIKGTVPIVKPRFILQPIFTKEQLLKINE